MVLDRIRACVGDRHVLAGTDMAAYTQEERGTYGSAPIAVVRPGSTQEMASVVTLCWQAGVPMVPQGGNTGLCGGAVAGPGAVILSTERLNAIRDIDPISHTMTVESGCILADIQAAAAAQNCLFPLSLAAEGSCRIGGNLSTNAGGVHVLRYGNCRDLVLGIEAVLPDGQIWNGLRALRKNNAGYDLKHLFIGAEGTLGIITAATLKLFPAIQDCQTAIAAVPSPQAAVELLAQIRQDSGDTVVAYELLPRIAIEFVLACKLPDPLTVPSPWYVLIELASTRRNGLGSALEDVLAAGMERGLLSDAVVAQSEAQRQALWKLRETIPESQKPQGASLKHDVSVSPIRVPEMLSRCITEVGLAVPGIRPVPFGHLGDGNIHLNFSQPVGVEKADFLSLRPLVNRIVHDIVIDMQGSIAAEHGVGLAKVGELAHYASPVELDLMRRVKVALDPKGLMNPGKVIAV